MRELTKAEEQIMQELWELGPSFVKEVIARLPEPKPAYSTVSTIIRILETKGFIDHEDFGSTYRYFPTVTKEEYTHFSIKKMLDGYFEGSLKKMVSFFSKKERMDIKEVDELLRILENQKDQQKK